MSEYINRAYNLKIKFIENNKIEKVKKIDKIINKLNDLLYLEIIDYINF